MANLKEIRNRISSVSSTMQITSAMKMVSAAKFKKAQDKLFLLRSYSEKLLEVTQNVRFAGGLEGGSPYEEKRKVEKNLYIAISSDRGLAGAFNSSVARELDRSIRKDPSHETEVLTIGKKALAHAKKNHRIHRDFGIVFDALNFENTAELVQDIMRDFLSGAVDEVYLVYNKLINASVQEVKTERILPISISPVGESGETDAVNYIFESPHRVILEELIHQMLGVEVYKAILESIASEHGARMTAMHKATENAQTLKDELLIYYNKARQAAITSEILEIVSGVEALKKA